MFTLPPSLFALPPAGTADHDDLMVVAVRSSGDRGCWKIGTARVAPGNARSPAVFRSRTAPLLPFPRREGAGDGFSELGGVLDFYVDDEHIKELFPGKGWDARRFSFQLSDHFPIWIQVRTDIDGQRLEQVGQNGGR
jgi:hypothetical protein